MKDCEITIINTCSGFNIDPKDIDWLNENDKSIEFSEGLLHGVISQNAILFMFDVVTNKEVLQAAVKLISQFMQYKHEELLNREKPKEVKFEFDGAVYSCSYPHDFSGEQVNRIIEGLLNSANKKH